MPRTSTTKKTNSEPAKAKYKNLKRKERTALIGYWRDCGWTYAEITTKFEQGVTEEEYQDAIRKMED